MTTAKPTVYVETSVISYLTNRPSTNAITLGRQLLTRRWWEEQAGQFELKGSDYVLDELAQGHPEAAQRRLIAAQRLKPLSIELPQIEVLASALLLEGALLEVARLDALHIATSCVHSVQLLATWNFANIANPQQMRRIEAICRAHDREPALIVTPTNCSKVIENSRSTV